MKVVCFAVLLASIARAEVTEGNVFVTHPMYAYRRYRGTVVQETPFVLESYNLDDFERQYVLLRCSRMCARLPECASYEVDYTSDAQTTTCKLYKQSLCTETPEDDLEIANTPAVFFDKVSTYTKSCLERCIEDNPGNCTACGMDGCYGSTCNVCGTTCSYQTQKTKNGAQDYVINLWPDTYTASSLKVVCKEDWTRIFVTDSKQAKSFSMSLSKEIPARKPQGPFYWMGFDLLTANMNKIANETLLKVVLMDDQTNQYEAVYSGFSMKSSSLKVVTFIGGTAGDGFGAPCTVSFIESDTLATLCGPYWQFRANEDLAKKANVTGSKDKLTSSDCIFGTFFFGDYVGSGKLSWSAKPKNVFTKVELFVK